MKKSEVAQLVLAVKAAYPRHLMSLTNADLENMIGAWQFTLEDYTFEEASIGLKAYLKSDSEGFPPSPGQVATMIQKIKFNPKTEITAAEAWELVYKAICDLRWDEPEIEFNKLPTACQRAIGSAAGLVQIAMMDNDDVMIGEKARFIRQYDSIREHEKDYERLPNRVKELIEQRALNRIEVKNESGR